MWSRSSLTGPRAASIATAHEIVVITPFENESRYLQSTALRAAVCTFHRYRAVGERWPAVRGVIGALW
jgi:hypothetical protein